MVSPSDNFFFAKSINLIKAKDWNECVGLDHPFTRYEFLAAEICCLNIIASLRKSINGDWNRLENFVKLGGFVNCKEGYSNQPKIINGASDLLVKIFGEQGKHTRFAVGSNSLPMNIAVEIDAIIKII